MKEKRKTALIIHRRRATADAFSTLYSFKRRRRRSSDSSSRRYSTGKHWARGSARCSAPPLCCPDLTQKQAPCRARFSPNPRPTLCNSNWDLIAAPLTPFIPRTDPGEGGKGGKDTPAERLEKERAAAAAEEKGRARAEPDPPKSQPPPLFFSLFREKGEFHNFGNSS